MLQDTLIALAVQLQIQTGTALDDISLSEPATLLAPVVALVVAYVFFYEGVLFTLGKDSRTWRTIRSWLPFLDEAARDRGFYTSYTISSKEIVGTLEVGVEEAVALFKNMGFIENPLAAHKDLEDGREEVASLGYYGVDGDRLEAMSKPVRFLTMLVLPRQLHVTLFPTEDGEGVVVTAHWEFSPYNVVYAYWHFIGRGMDVDKGVRKVVDRLKNRDEFVATDRAKQLWLEYQSQP